MIFHPKILCYIQNVYKTLKDAGKIRRKDYIVEKVKEVILTSNFRCVVKIV